MQEESIYNLIARNPEETPKGPLYRSKYPHNIPPTGSTFGHHTTSKPRVSNLSGEFQFGLQAHRPDGAAQTFGHLPGARNSSPTEFQSKRSGTMGSNQLPPARNFSYDCSHKKPKVPRVTEKPLLGRKSNKNFIVANAVQNILSTPKQAPLSVDWTKKKDYGRAPQYLQTIRQTLENQYNMIRTLHEQKQQKKQALSQEEVQELREGLKAKWDEINKQYQKLTHIRLIDTQGLKRRKEHYERQLAQIEADIKKLNKNYIFVEN